MCIRPFFPITTSLVPRILSEHSMYTVNDLITIKYNKFYNKIGYAEFKVYEDLHNFFLL